MPKKLITKHISDLTDEDKVQYLTYLKESFDVNYGWDWDSLVPQIMEKIDYIFSHDDETDPDPASIAARAYFRKYSKQQGQQSQQSQEQSQEQHQDQSRSPQQHQGQQGQGQTQQEGGQKPSLADFLIVSVK